MEDVLVLTEMMFEKYPNDRLKAFEEYSKHRNPDAEAMCDLAMYNYVEVILAFPSYMFKELRSFDISDERFGQQEVLPSEKKA